MKVLETGLILIERDEEPELVVAAIQSVTPELVEKWRVHKRLSVSELGIACNISRPTMSNYLNGSKAMSLPFKARFIKLVENNPDPTGEWIAPNLLVKRADIEGVLHQGNCLCCGEPMEATSGTRKVHDRCKKAWKAKRDRERRKKRK